MAVNRYITLGDGRRVGLGAYVAGIRQAIANPDVFFRRGLDGWDATGREIRNQFLTGVHDRINQGVPYLDRGKGETDD